jgi:Fusaric acid resistance protein-like
VVTPLKRTIAVLVLLALVSAPAVVSVRLGAGDMAGSVVLAAVAGLIAAVFVPVRMALAAAALIGVGSGVAVTAADLPLLAAVVMAGCGVAMGFAAKQGAASAVALAPVTVGFTLSEPPADSAVVVALAMLGSAAWGVGLGALVRRRLPTRTLTALGTERAFAYGAILALLAGISGYFVAVLQPGHAGGWLLMTYFVVVQPYLQNGWRKAVERAGGTVLGFGIAVLIGLITEVRTALFVIGVLALILGMWIWIKGHPYWQSTTVMTVGIVMAEGASTSVISTAEQRLAATVIGVGASLLAMAVLRPFYRREAAKVGTDHY